MDREQYIKKLKDTYDMLLDKFECNEFILHQERDIQCYLYHLLLEGEGKVSLDEIHAEAPYRDKGRDKLDLQLGQLENDKDAVFIEIKPLSIRELYTKKGKIGKGLGKVIGDKGDIKKLKGKDGEKCSRQLVILYTKGHKGSRTKGRHLPISSDEKKIEKNLWEKVKNDIYNYATKEEIEVIPNEEKAMKLLT